MYVTLLTEKFGVIRVVASGLRYEKSKLRYALQKYAYAEVTLVRGKNTMWRLTTGVAKPDFLFSTLNDKKKREVAKIFMLLENIVAGEDVDTALFEIIKSGLFTLAKEQDENVI